MNTNLAPEWKARFSSGRRKRKRQHRQAARRLLRNGGLFNNFSAVGSNLWIIAQWHLKMARYC